MSTLQSTLLIIINFQRECEYKKQQLMHAQRRGGREGGREWRAIGCLTLFRMKMSLAGARMVSGDKAWLSQSFIVLGGGGGTVHAAHVLSVGPAVFSSGSCGLMMEFSTHDPCQSIDDLVKHGQACRSTSIFTVQLHIRFTVKWTTRLEQENYRNRCTFCKEAVRA